VHVRKVRIYDVGALVVLEPEALQQSVLVKWRKNNARREEMF
jgi:hypothetical protein